MFSAKKREKTSHVKKELFGGWLPSKAERQVGEKQGQTKPKKFGTRRLKQGNSKKGEPLRQAASLFRLGAWAEINLETKPAKIQRLNSGEFPKPQVLSNPDWKRVGGCPERTVTGAEGLIGERSKLLKDL